MGKRTTSAAVVAAIVLGSLGLLATGASAATSEEARFLDKLNQERTSRGLTALVSKGDLVTIARRHSDRMKAAGDIFHNQNLANEVSGDWRRLGENVGAGYGVGSLHQAFMDSAPHRANILRAAYNQVGIGVKIDEDLIYVTVVFAKRSAAKATTATKAPAKAKAKPRAATPAKKAATPAAAPAKASAAPASQTPAAAPAKPARQAVDNLVRMIGLDADTVDPATGLAAGF